MTLPTSKTSLPAVDFRQRRLLIALVGSAVLVVMLLMGLQLWSSHRESLREAATKTHNYAAIIEARLDATLRRADVVLRAATQEVPAEAMSKQAVPRYASQVRDDLDRDMANFSELSGLRIFDASGELLYSSSTEGAPRPSVADRSYFRALRDDPRAGLVFSEVVTSTATGRRSIVAARAMRDARGSFQGVALALIELEQFKKLFQTLDVGARGVVVIRRSDDYSGVVRWPELEREINRPLPPGNPVREAMQAGKPAGTLAFPASSDGELRTYSYRSVVGYPFFVLVALAHDDALAGWRERSLAIGASGLLLLTLLGALLARLWRLQAREAQAVSALQGSEERLRLALSASEQGMYDLDVKTGDAMVNAEYASMLGYDPAQFRETNGAWVERLHPDDRERVAGVYRDYVAGKLTDYRVEFRQRTQGGTYKWILSVGKLVERDADGQPLRMLGTHLDISERKEAELALRDLNLQLERRVDERTAELKRARDQAETASRAKSDFLAAMSHDLRTPLNAILGFSQLLESDATQPLTDRHRAQVHQIGRAGAHLLALINDVLDLARVEAGKQAISLEPVQVAKLLDDCLSLMRPLAVEHRIRLPASAPAACDGYVTADRTRLKQVLLNLLSNAIKYNHTDGSVQVSCMADPAEPQYIRIGVSDTGPGLDPVQRERLFQAFDRLGADTGAIQGAGIGLMLSKRLVELMNGRMGVESEPGQGSTFWVRLARAEPSIAPDKSEGPVLMSGPKAMPGQATRTVLYVEDNPVNALLMEAMVEREPGVRLLHAALPEQGLELARTEKPHLILLDIQLPGIDGFEVLRRLRADDSTRGIPVVAVSASAMDGDVARGLVAGFDDYLTKPVELPRLLGVFGRLMRG